MFAFPDCVCVVEAKQDKEDECCPNGEDGDEDCGESAVQEEFGEVVEDDGWFECFESCGGCADDDAVKGCDECGECDV